MKKLITLLLLNLIPVFGFNCPTPTLENQISNSNFIFLGTISNVNDNFFEVTTLTYLKGDTTKTSWDFQKGRWIPHEQLTSKFIGGPPIRTKDYIVGDSLIVFVKIDQVGFGYRLVNSCGFDGEVLIDSNLAVIPALQGPRVNFGFKNREELRTEIELPKMVEYIRTFKVKVDKTNTIAHEENHLEESILSPAVIGVIWGIVIVPLIFLFN